MVLILLEKSVYISGARYVGTKGVSVVGAAGSFSDLFVTGVSTFQGNTWGFEGNVNVIQGDGTTSIVGATI